MLIFFHLPLPNRFKPYKNRIFSSGVHLPVRWAAPFDPTSPTRIDGSESESSFADAKCSARFHDVLSTLSSIPLNSSTLSIIFLESSMMLLSSIFGFVSGSLVWNVMTRCNDTNFEVAFNGNSFCVEQDTFFATHQRYGKIPYDVPYEQSVD